MVRGSCVFLTMNMTNIDENTQNPPLFYVKHENTRKTGTKMVENALVSQIDKISRVTIL